MEITEQDRQAIVFIANQQLIEKGYMLPHNVYYALDCKIDVKIVASVIAQEANKGNLNIDHLQVISTTIYIQYKPLN